MLCCDIATWIVVIAILKGDFQMRRVLNFVLGCISFMMIMIIFLASYGLYTDGPLISEQDKDGFDTMLFFCYMILALSLFGIIMIAVTFRRCKSCKKWFAMVESDRNVVETRTQFREEKVGETRSIYNGNVIGENFAKIEYKRDIYEMTYTCKHCGSTKQQKGKSKWYKTNHVAMSQYL